MTKTTKQVNGGIAPEVMARLANDEADILAARAKVVPVKSEAVLLMELEIERLKAENQRLQSRPQTGLSLKISEKGALSIYGMGRFPTTLYVEQWERVLAHAEDIKAFIKANTSKLSRKE